MELPPQVQAYIQELMNQIGVMAGRAADHASQAAALGIELQAARAEIERLQRESTVKKN